MQKILINVSIFTQNYSCHTYDGYIIGMCGIDFFSFGSVSVCFFFFKLLIWFGMNLIRFGSKNAVQFGYYCYLLLNNS